MKKKLNIICPVFNEEDCIFKFFERVESIKSKLDNYEIELFFSNNCSTDKTYEIITGICSKNKWVNLITLTRNFGYQGSVFGSLKETNADLYFIVDALEDNYVDHASSDNCHGPPPSKYYKFFYICSW